MRFLMFNISALYVLSVAFCFVFHHCKYTKIFDMQKKDVLPPLRGYGGRGGVPTGGSGLRPPPRLTAGVPCRGLGVLVPLRGAGWTGAPRRGRCPRLRSWSPAGTVTPHVSPKDWQQIGRGGGRRPEPLHVDHGHQSPDGAAERRCPILCRPCGATVGGVVCLPGVPACGHHPRLTAGVPCRGLGVGTPLRTRE